MSALQAPDLVRGLCRHWLAVVVVALLGAGGGMAVTILVPDDYVARAEVRVLHDTRFDVLEDAPADTYETVDEANRRMNSVAMLALSDDIVDNAADDAGLPAEAVRDGLTVEPKAGADVLVISAHSADAAQAARLARSAADAFVEVTRESGRTQLVDGAFRLEREAGQVLDDGPDPVPAELSSYAGQLYARALDLRSRAAVYEGAGELVTAPAVPTEPAAPGLAEGAAYGLAGGLLAGIAVALLLSMRRVPASVPSGTSPEAIAVGSR